MAPLKSTYKIINNLNIILEYHSGNLDVDSYIKFKQKVFSDKNFKPGLNHLIHFKNITFIYPDKNLKLFVDFIKSNTSVLGKRKIAFITSTPNHVVTTTIYDTLLADNSQQISVFSTNNSALNWLIQSPLDINNLIEVLKDMKKEVKA
ncbi:hypothetical protein MHL31_00440 [Lutibacter sp. A80]|uniref:hypothetical protein n=1 Tax=Lutibacter sp. A80 TaxID=2918453 RepID=UPI001F06E617|nr:hypothetical protein [Lutibacter sp. A80]UMB60696.1 hypothetical protein MHL31_00440 [Lutibacter sp. A80]